MTASQPTEDVPAPGPADRPPGGVGRVLVAGGSVGGLAAAHELLAVGHSPTVLERSGPNMVARGAGIVVQPEIESLLARTGIDLADVSVPLSERQQLHRDASPARYPAPQRMTAWDALHRALRTALPQGVLHFNSEVTGTAVDGPDVTATLAGGRTASGSFLVGADGLGSAVRSLLDPTPASRYAGYVAWRGLVDERGVPPVLRDLLAGRFSFFGAPGTQFLTYLVPGAGGEVRRGARRINWVWYVDTSRSTLGEQLRGQSGRTYRTFLPQHDMRDAVLADVHDLTGTLPGPFADLVAASEPFMQPIVDLSAGLRFRDRVALIGDAAGTVRPHTAAGTAKALGDAAELARALRDWDPATPPPTAALDRWSERRGHVLSEVAAAGVGLARRSQLGASAATSDR